ncbi:hypothetical protein NDU88_003435 [Pleurodeles waltl]|uniref:Gag protein n=1 Tax=Pleurodeles waltl TaxID=8319 RepID=A0AAV7W5A3_PLEWA|nr:hypothetical protein NDU88_003435 [Pleurodeles waltl]
MGDDQPAAPALLPPQHAMVGALQLFSKLVDPATASPWRKIWIRRLKNDFIATREHDEAVKRSLLLLFCGDEIYKLFRHLPSTGAKAAYNISIIALNAHFDPQLNPDLKKFKIHQARQRERESIDQFYSRLRELASTYTADDQPKEIRAQSIQGCCNKTLRGLIRRQPNISLNDILILARSHNLSPSCATEIDAALTQMPEKGPTIKVKCADAVRAQHTKGKPTTPARQRPCCMYYSREEHAARDCLAQVRLRCQCGKMNHFATVCHSSTQVRGARGRHTQTSTMRHLSPEDPGQFELD